MPQAEQAADPTAGRDGQVLVGVRAHRVDLRSGVQGGPQAPQAATQGKTKTKLLLSVFMVRFST